MKFQLTKNNKDSEFGIVYLVQPAELLGTMRYKVGASGQPDVSRIVNGYRIGTRWLKVEEVSYPFVLEDQIKKYFTDKGLLYSGKEIFEVTDEGWLRQSFQNFLECRHRWAPHHV